jgi:MoaA/NifB/PqqE/SkfB family radical SAM enzyme
MPTNVDVEVTNRCNAKCHFCPRDRTPHQGLMSPEVFAKALERAVEYRGRIADLPNPEVHVSLCGLGEPLLNRNVVDYVRLARAEGFFVKMSSNASLLDERRSVALLEAGLQQILINVGEEGDDYEAVYHLPFERTLQNVLRFNEMSAGACEVTMVIVDHRGDPDHVAGMTKYWSDRGVPHAVTYEVMNRGGSLFVEHMQYGTYPEQAVALARLEGELGGALCAAPFLYLFVGYDGQYYLCCADWEKQAPLGSIFDMSFVDIVGQKLEHLRSREPVCKTCNLDPLNKLTDEIRAEAAGQVPPGSADALIDAIGKETGLARSAAAIFGHPFSAEETRKLGPYIPTKARRYIPVSAV